MKRIIATTTALALLTAAIACNSDEVHPAASEPTATAANATMVATPTQAAISATASNTRPPQADAASLATPPAPSTTDQSTATAKPFPTITTATMTGPTPQPTIVPTATIPPEPTPTLQQNAKLPADWPKICEVWPHEESGYPEGGTVNFSQLPNRPTIIVALVDGHAWPGAKYDQSMPNWDLINNLFLKYEGSVNFFGFFEEIPSSGYPQGVVERSYPLLKASDPDCLWHNEKFGRLEIMFPGEQLSRWYGITETATIPGLDEYLASAGQ